MPFRKKKKKRQNNIDKNELSFFNPKHDNGKDY